MGADSKMANSAELNSFVEKFRYLCSAGFKASLTFNSDGVGHACVSFQVDLGFIQPPSTVPPPTSPLQKCRSPAYYRRLKKRRELRQKTDPLCENTTSTQNDATTVTEKVMIVNEETNVQDDSVEDSCRELEIEADVTEEVIDSKNDMDVEEVSCAEEAMSNLNLVEVDKSDRSTGKVVENAICHEDLKLMRDGRNDCEKELLPIDNKLSAIEKLQNLTMSLDLIGRCNYNTVSLT